MTKMRSYASKSGVKMKGWCSSRRVMVEIDEWWSELEALDGLKRGKTAKGKEFCPY